MDWGLPEKNRVKILATIHYPTKHCINDKPQLNYELLESLIKIVKSSFVHKIRVYSDWSPSIFRKTHYAALSIWLWDISKFLYSWQLYPLCSICKITKKILEAKWQAYKPGFFDKFSANRVFGFAQTLSFEVFPWFMSFSFNYGQFYCKL